MPCLTFNLVSRCTAAPVASPLLDDLATAASILPLFVSSAGSPAFPFKTPTIALLH
uniref:Uncharacterized protein n=1 Tax=Anguilla anguilla TaxID=7936 RepID=A0A0E9PD39_ANGAN